MRRVLLMCLAAVLLTAGVASANTVWNPVANTEPNDFNEDGSTNWNIPANWNGGTGLYPGIANTETTDAKAVFNVADQAECQINTYVEVGTLSMGDGGAESPHNSVIRVMDGGTLHVTAGSWSAIGYSRKGNTMIVEEGGLVDWDAHLYLAMNGTGSPQESEGTVIMNGGTFLIQDTFRYGREAGAEGYVYLNSGLFEARYLNGTGPFGGVIDIKYGKYRLTGGEDSDRDYLQRDIDNGYVVAFGGLGTLNLAQEDNGDWYVTANNPMNPSPAYDELVAVSDVPAEALVDLEWTNLEPNAPGDPVYVDVWFGTDPNKLNPLVYALEVPAGLNTTTVTVNAPVVGTPPTTYYWQVDSYIYGAGHVNEPNMIEGDVFKFHVTDDLPPTVEIVDPNAPTVTWVNEPVQLDATITDTGSSAVSIVWTTSDPNVVFSPSNTVEDPTVASAAAIEGAVTLTVTVSDAGNPGIENFDTLQLTVAADECAAAVIAGASYVMDLTGDCVIDIDDLGVLAVQWLDDYALTTPIEIIEQP